MVEEQQRARVLLGGLEVEGVELGSDRLGVVGLVISAHTLGMFALSPVTGWLTDRFGPVRIIVAGDSTANATGSGVLSWAAANPDIAQAELVTAPGCGFLMGGERLVGDEGREDAVLAQSEGRARARLGPR